MPHLLTSRDSCLVMSSLHLVWERVTQRLRELRASLAASRQQLYEGQDRLAYMNDVQDALKSLAAKRLASIDSFVQLEQLVDKVSSGDECAEDAVITAQQFVIRCKTAFDTLQHARVSLTNDILRLLRLYCGTYRKLGIADDTFYKTLQTRTAVVEEHVQEYELMASAITDGAPIVSELFSDCLFSQEVAIKLDCETLPVLRLMPDLIQKLEMASDIAADWLRSDRVYIEQIEQEIEALRHKVKDTENALAVKQAKYERAFVALKVEQTTFSDAAYEDLHEEVHGLEVKRVHLVATVYTMARCTPQPDCAATSDSESELELSYSAAHSLFRSRLQEDASAHASQVNVLRRQQKKLEASLDEKRNQLQNMEQQQQRVQQCVNKLRSLGRQKARLTEESRWLRGQLDSLVTYLQHRLYPEQQHQQRAEKLAKSGKNKRKHSIELEEAFKVVKNQIGLRWKDLARSLPYSLDMDIAQVNSEITATEYENQGQLKEQAYQTLVKWSDHNGRRASLERLQETLRELNENRLADDIEQQVLGQTTDSSRPSSAL